MPPVVRDHPRARESSIAFRHRMHQWHRSRVVAAFERILVHEGRMYSYLGCGSGGWVVHDPDDPTKVALRSECCHDRWCPACGKSRSMVIRCNIEPLLKDKTVRFITLTLKHNDEPLKQRLDHLHSSFATLRKTALWRDKVDAGVAFLEVKHSEKSGRWHPHFHIVSVGRYLPHDALAAAWLAITGDSIIVDVRVVKDQSQVAQYVTKYCSKPAPNELYRDPEKLDAAIIAMKGRRLLTTFGAWRGTALCKNASLTDWVPVMSWPDLLTACRLGDIDAITIYKSLTRNEWCCDDTDIDDTRAPP